MIKFIKHIAALAVLLILPMSLITGCSSNNGEEMNGVPVSQVKQASPSNVQQLTNDAITRAQDRRAAAIQFAKSANQH